MCQEYFSFGVHTSFQPILSWAAQHAPSPSLVRYLLPGISFRPASNLGVFLTLDSWNYGASMISIEPING